MSRIAYITCVDVELDSKMYS